MQCSSISLEKSTELSLTDLPKDTLANLGFNLDVVHPKYFKDCKVGSVAQTCLPAFLDKHFGERVRDLTSQDVKNLTFSFREQMTPEQYKAIQEKHGSVGRMFNVKSLLDMEKQVQENQNHALKELWGCIAPTLETAGHITAGEKDMAADEIRAWMNNPQNQDYLQLIQKVDLSNTDLVVIPPEIGSLTQLQWLSLSDNQIEGISPEVQSLAQLRVLGLGGNQIQAIPGEIGNLGQLTELRLQNNQIEVIPPEIGSLGQLIILNLSGNQIKVIPPEIGNLAQLQTLSLSENQIEVIPPEIGRLTQLQQLYLNNNRIKVIPPEIGKLTGLRWLFLSENQMKMIPPEIDRLTQLRILSPTK